MRLSDDWVRDRISKLAIEFTSCGLTLNQARIYLYLLIRGASPVRVISKSVGLHRVDVYRKLHELDELGLLETHLDSPKRYAAVAPKDVAPILLRRQEERLATYKAKSSELFAKLDTLRGTVLDREKFQSGVGSAEGSYRLVTGRKRYYDELRQMMRSAEKEVLRIVSSGGLVRTFLTGLDKEYSLANSRGVSLQRGLTPDDIRDKLREPELRASVVQSCATAAPGRGTPKIHFGRQVRIYAEREVRRNVPISRFS